MHACMYTCVCMAICERVCVRVRDAYGCMCKHISVCMHVHNKLTSNRGTHEVCSINMLSTLSSSDTAIVVVVVVVVTYFSVFGLSQTDKSSKKRHR